MGRAEKYALTLIKLVYMQAKYVNVRSAILGPLALSTSPGFFPQPHFSFLLGGGGGGASRIMGDFVNISQFYHD